ncbi:FadR/GntR family transcriptional regulator [Falsiroseomonas sp. E2-1-a20]|uniref:FadR/GntR family transcriptional regulator n=1 Tax=Falsiroseomonas sp. E2-1-a20 TaxID=3239300 RepID=UPI003F313668
MQTDSAARARLEDYLRAEGLRDGDRVPPERDLAPRLGLSRRALRNALQALELEGRLWRGVGQGTWLGEAPAASLRTVGGDPQAVMEARRTLEPALAGLAAIKAAPTDIEAIRRCARRGAETQDQESWGRWDAAFHRAVAFACHNPLLRQAFEQLEACRAGTEWGRLRGLIANAALRQHSAAQHLAIAAAIADRDAAAAHRAMWDHLQTVHQAIQATSADAGGRTASSRRAA